MPLEFEAALGAFPDVLVVDVVGVFCGYFDAAGAEGAGDLFGPARGSLVNFIFVILRR